nr:glutamate--cysteine ligase [Rubritepida sp.]
MSNPGQADPTPITSARQLAEWFASGEKPRSAWTIGTEHEKFGFRRSDLSPPDYAQRGIRAVLEALMAKGWAPIEDAGNVIGLTRGRASVSLEPGGQLELSGAPLADLHATRLELAEHLREVHEVAAPLDLGFAGMGFHPLARRDAMPWMPKSRYAIMRGYMPKKGSLGLDMMLRTATVQVNLDFGDEADMVEKLRVSLALQPLATALFACSPFRDGAESGYRSLRGHVWTDTDADRSGIPACVFEDGFGYERFAEFVLDVPMYFVAREGRLHDVAGASFRDFMAGRVDALRGIAATMGDVADHVTTVFTDVRLKRYLEMRGADAGSAAMLLAQPAFWVGLLYDDAAQKAAAALTRGWTLEALRALRAEVPRAALGATIAGRSLRDVALDALAIARDGLRARGL